MNGKEREEANAERAAVANVHPSKLQFQRRGHPRAAKALDLAVRINWLRGRLDELEPRLDAILAEPETEAAT